MNYMLVAQGSISVPQAFIPLNADNDADAVLTAQRYIRELGDKPFWRFALFICDEKEMAAMVNAIPNPPFVTFESRTETIAVPFKA